jgi:hypothetical protein
MINCIGLLIFLGALAMNVMRILLLGALAILAVCSYLTEPGDVVQAQKTEKKTVIRISPSDLFPGDLRRIAPHLDLTASCCVKVDFEGPKSLKTQVEEWQGGKAITSKPFAGFPYYQGYFSVSVRETLDRDGKWKYKVICDSLGDVNKLFIDIPKTAIEDHVLISRCLRRDTIIKGNESVAIWTMMQWKLGQPVSGDDEIEQLATKSVWALVVKLSIADKK